MGEAIKKHGFSRPWIYGSRKRYREEGSQGLLPVHGHRKIRSERELSE
ncbi:MAG: hypothetical protein ACFFD4_32175 [Candidatus Odinarchaeota archaeon]